MKTRQYSLFFIATALQLALTNQSTFAFSITGNKQVQTLKYTMPVRGKEQDAPKATALEHGVIEKVANLIPVELTDRNAVEVDGLRMEIVQPELVLRIPENRSGVSTLVTIDVRIIIKSPNRLGFMEYSNVVPELVDPDGQALEWQQVPGIGEKGRCFAGGFTNEAGDYPIHNRLYWRNNKLTLGFVDVARNSSVRLFENLKPGTYRLRFTYKNCGERIPCLNPPVTTESWGVKPLEPDRCATQFVNLRLVY